MMREMLKAVANVDAKRLLRVSWVTQLSVVIAVSVVLIFAWPERIDGWAKVLGPILGAIAFEGAAAAGGSQLKRITEAHLTRAQNGCEENGREDER